MAQGIALERVGGGNGGASGELEGGRARGVDVECMDGEEMVQAWDGAGGTAEMEGVVVLQPCSGQLAVGGETRLALTGWYGARGMELEAWWPMPM